VDIRVLRGIAGALSVGCAAVALAGCAAVEQPDVEQVVVAFAAGDPAARCALLAPATLAALERSTSTGCAQAVADVATGGTVLHTAVWGDAAQVRTAEDTVFLTRTGGGWKISAAGCTRTGDAPYGCEVDGP
jgi:hypothetical protein